MQLKIQKKVQGQNLTSHFLVQGQNQLKSMTAPVPHKPPMTLNAVGFPADFPFYCTGYNPQTLGGIRDLLS